MRSSPAASSAASPRNRLLKRVISKWLGVVTIFALILVGCASDPTASDEYQALEAELTSMETDNESMVAELAELRATVAATVIPTDTHGQAASAEVNDFLDMYHLAFATFDVEAVLGMYATGGEWISDTPPGRDVYSPIDGEFSPMAFTNPIGGFLRWLETVDFAFDSRGEAMMIVNQAGDIYVSFPSSWHFTFQSKEYRIAAFTVMWLVGTEDGLKVMRHWNLTPQTALSP